MQYGVLDRVERRRGSDVWTYRWRERGPSGHFICRRRVIGTLQQFKNKRAARRATAGLVREINSHDFRVKLTTMTVAQLVDHYQLRELRPENPEKNFSTKAAYNCYLRKWVLPRWGEHTLPRVRASEVEEWLKYLKLSAGSRSKLRNVMSVVFNHAIRHYLYDRNPISQVRQSAKRRASPCVLSSSDIQAILAGLTGMEHLLVLIAASTWPEAISALTVTKLRSRGARSRRSHKSRNRTSVVYCTTPGATFPLSLGSVGERIVVQALGHGR